MKKVVIVGVEGSGKTVFLVAMADKYEAPDRNGVFLTSVNEATYGCYAKARARLRDGEWPLATQPGEIVELDWKLRIKGGPFGSWEELARLSFLDFAGEVYREAFGGREESENAKSKGLPPQEAVDRLKSHVQDADVLIVLVDLGKIVNGSERDDRTIEMNWLSQAILSFAFEEAHKQSVALVFTQSDRYEEIVRQCGGVRGALAKYLRIVDTNYGDRLPLFAVSAVDSVVPMPDNPALLLPAPDFKSRGFEDLMSWLVGRLRSDGAKSWRQKISAKPSPAPEKVDAPKSSLTEESAKDEGAHGCGEPLMMGMYLFVCAIHVMLTLGQTGVFVAFATLLCIFFASIWAKNHHGRFAAYILSVCIAGLVCLYAALWGSPCVDKEEWRSDRNHQVEASEAEAKSKRKAAESRIGHRAVKALEERDGNGQTPFLNAVLKAVKTGDLSEMEELKRKGARLDAVVLRDDKKGCHGFAALHLVALEGGEKWSVKTAKWLLENGAEINGKVKENTGDARDFSPLLVAIQRCHLDDCNFEGQRKMISLFLERGADANQPAYCIGDDNDGTFTPLFLACAHLFTDIVELLLQHGAQPSSGNMQSGRGLPVFHLLCASGDLAKSPKYKDILRLLIRHGADVNAKCMLDFGKWTPLMAAASDLNIPAMEILLENGANMRASSSPGIGVLCMAFARACSHEITLSHMRAQRRWTNARKDERRFA